MMMASKSKLFQERGIILMSTSAEHQSFIPSIPSQLRKLISQAQNSTLTQSSSNHPSSGLQTLTKRYSPTMQTSAQLPLPIPYISTRQYSPKPQSSTGLFSPATHFSPGRHSPATQISGRRFSLSLGQSSLWLYQI